MESILRRSPCVVSRLPRDLSTWLEYFQCPGHQTDGIIMIICEWNPKIQWNLVLINWYCANDLYSSTRLKTVGSYKYSSTYNSAATAHIWTSTKTMGSKSYCTSTQQGFMHELLSVTKKKTWNSVFEVTVCELLPVILYNVGYLNAWTNTCTNDMGCMNLNWRARVRS